MSRTRFSGSVGYRGVVKIQKNEARDGSTHTMVPILATNGSFQMGHNPIFAGGVWGAGYMNAVEQTIYANDFARLEGSVGLEYTAGDVFEAIKAMCFDFRGNKYGTFLQILPDGVHGFSGFGWATSLSFSASQGQIVTGDFNWTSYLDGINNVVTVDDDEDSDSEINTPYGAIGTQGGAGKPASDPFYYNGVYPYWGTDVVSGSSISSGTVADSKIEKDIISWSASYDSSIEVLKCCGMTNPSTEADQDDETYIDNLTDSHAPLAPDYLGIGPMSANCNMEIFRLQGDFSDNSLHQRKAFRFILHTPYDSTYTAGSTTGANTYWIDLPRVVCNSKQSQAQPGNGWVTASYSFSALGDFMGPPLGLNKNA